MICTVDLSPIYEFFDLAESWTPSLPLEEGRKKGRKGNLLILDVH